MSRHIVHRFADAVEAGDPDGIALLFSEQAVYNDLVYGVFTGREAIAGMFRHRWFRDAARFRWDMLDLISDGRTAYAHWVHSFDLLNPPGRQRVAVDGASQFLIAPDGTIENYREWTEGFGSLLQAGASRSTIDFIMTRHDATVRDRPEAAAHLV